DWAACEAALKAAPTLPATRRADAIIDACRPCGDWAPILTWSRLPANGGPTRTQIENAMVACKAYCEPNAKMRFLGTLDDARMNGARTPWRELGEMCREHVSAVPDARYMSASYFALDRIARDVVARPGGPELLAAIEMPLPPVSVSAVGIKIPDSPLSKPQLMRVGITVTVGEISIGTLPVAKLGANGVTVSGDAFPGRAVTLKDLPTELAKLGQPAAVFAPARMPAARLAEVVAGAGGWSEPVYLAVTAQTGAYGIVPVALKSPAGQRIQGLRLKLGASPDEALTALKAAGPEKLKTGTVMIEIDKAATIAGLATLIGALAFFEVPVVALVPPKA
ncbi:MAG: hypothetical protein H0T42_30195, partial [Deltaproteobacteria bacterium]|nr:hypothetical protein [Deltaproteobacteria bacterium]